MNLEHLYKEFFENLLEGRRKKCTSITEEAIKNGVDIKLLYMNIFERALVEIGNLWQSNIISVANEHLCTAIIQSIMMQIHRHIKPVEPVKGKIVIACIGKELHEVGARMVADFFEMEGWDVTYLGASMPSRDLIGMVEMAKPDVVGISCTIASHVEYVRELTEKLKSVDNNLKIAVGGYCFNRRPELYKYVGADIWTPNALDTVNACNAIFQAR
ncbi:MAG: cobalamin-dependent protein [Clostridia bacterium]|nr:cobalamin-dependent protein [Clostridia bacterium]